MKWPWSRTNRDEQPIIWSASLGRHERHLKRRHRNLLFPSERRVVTQPEVDDARGLDQAELRDLRLRTRTSLEAFDGLSKAGDVATGMHVIQSLEELREACVAEGSDAIQCVPAIDELQRHVSAAVAAALSDKPDVLAKFKKAQELRESIRARLASPIVLDLRRVPPEDLIYSLVSESPEVIVVFLQALSEKPEVQTLLRAHGRRALADAVGEGYPTKEAAARVRALGETGSNMNFVAWIKERLARRRTLSDPWLRTATDIVRLSADRSRKLNELSSSEREHVLQPLAAELLALSNSVDRVIACREWINRLFEEYARIRVLFTSKDETTSELDNPLFHPCVLGLADHADEVIKVSFRDELEEAASVEEVKEQLRTRSILLNFYVNVANAIRLSLQDKADFADRDWFQPFFAATCAVWELAHRQNAGLPQRCEAIAILEEHRSIRENLLRGIRDPLEGVTFATRGGAA